MTSARSILSSLAGTAPAVRFQIVGGLGRIRNRKLRGSGVGYYLDFRPYGRVWSHRGIQITDRATANRLLEQIRGEVAKGRALPDVLAAYLPATSKSNLAGTWLARWIAIRCREADAGSLSPNYVSELKRLARPGGHLSFFDDKSIYEIDYGVLEDYSLWLASRGLGAKSRRNYVAIVKAFLRWLRRRETISHVPDFPLPKCDEHEPRILSIRDQDAVLEAIPDAERGIFLALAHLGLRPGEARALTVADYHGNGWLTVSKAVKGKCVSSPIGGTKTGKPKRLPVSEPLRDWIERHAAATGRLRSAPLFPNPRTGRIWPHKALARAWKHAVDRAGLPHVGLYEGTKHSFATDAFRRGVRERLLQTFLGHASVESTRRYARLAENALVEVLRQPAELTSDKRATSLARTKPRKSARFEVGPPGFEPGRLRL
jgi:integrase